MSRPIDFGRKKRGMSSVDENSFLTMRDENMNLKRDSAKAQQKMKEMSTQLAVLTRKLAKLQTGDGQVDANSDEVLARIESQNRDLRRQNKELSAKISTARRNPRKSRPGTAPMAARASPSRSTRSWIPPSGGGAEFEAKLRKILQERDMQIRSLQEEKERLQTQLERGGGAAGDLSDLQHQVKSRQSQLDLAESKYEQLYANFNALKMNHERALAQVDELNKDMQDERRKTSALGHDKKLLQVTKDRVAELEQHIDRLRIEKREIEDQNAKLTAQALSGQASAAYKEKIKILEKRVQDLTEANTQMEESVRVHADEVSGLKDKLKSQGKTYGSFQNEKVKIETDLAQLQRQNQELAEKVSVFTGDTGINIDDLEKALTMVKKGHVAGPVAADVARTSSQDITVLKREKAELVQDLDKLQRLLELQDKINMDYKAEIDAQTQKFEQMRREYDHKLQDANRTLASRTDRVRSLESRLRSQAYTLSRTEQRDGALLDSMLRGSSMHMDDAASELSDGVLDFDVGEGQNVFEFTVRQLDLDSSVGDSGTPPATFFTFDFFEHETQTTPVVSGMQQRLDYTSQFVVKLDAFFLNYLATKTMSLELLETSGGMDFRSMAKCEVSFRPLLESLAASNGAGNEMPFVEATGEMVAVTGGGSKESPLVRTVVGTVTYRLRFRRPATQAVKLIQDRLAKVTAGRTMEMPAASFSSTDTGPSEARELCVLVRSVEGLTPRQSDSVPTPYVHYRLLDFPEHFTPSGQGEACQLNDLECYQLQVGDEKSPIARWLSTGSIDFTVFDDADDKAEFYFGTGKVRLAELIDYPYGKISSQVSLTDADGNTNGTVTVEIFWSHAITDDERAAQDSAKEQTEATAKDAAESEPNVEELMPLEGPPGVAMTSPIDLSKKPNNRYQAADDNKTGTAAEAVAPESEAASGEDTQAQEPTITIQVHRIELSEDLVKDESIPQVYVAVEWLQDGDEDGAEAKELETPSKDTLAIIEYEGTEGVDITDKSVYGNEIKRKMAEGKVEVEFALVKDPGGDNPECDDLGVASLELCKDILDAGADIVTRKLVVEEDNKKLADIVVSISALDAMRSLKS